jgi:hypothetical protein
LNKVAFYSIKSSTQLPDMYGRFAQTNTSAGQYATLLGEVSLMLLDQVTFKNSKGMWDQDIRVQELGAEGMENPEKKLRLLFTSGSGQKRTQGKSLWNLEGMKYFHQVGKKWEQVYDYKKDMRVLYNGWERWITTTGADIKIGDGSKKTFQTIMGSWCEDFSQTSKMGEKQDDGYSSDRGLSRHYLDYHSGKLGKNSSDDLSRNICFHVLSF